MRNRSRGLRHPTLGSRMRPHETDERGNGGYRVVMYGHCTLYSPSSSSSLSYPLQLSDPYSTSSSLASFHLESLPPSLISMSVGLSATRANKRRNRGEAVLFNPKHCDHKTQNNVPWARNRMQVRMTDVSSTCCRGHAQIVHKHGECVPDG